MAWLLHHDDFAALKANLPAAVPSSDLPFAALAGAVDIRPDPTVERGKMKDERCPWAGALSPRAFSLLQEQLRQDDERELKKAAALFKKLTGGARGVADTVSVANPSDPAEASGVPVFIAKGPLGGHGLGLRNLVERCYADVMSSTGVPVEALFPSSAYSSAAAAMAHLEVSADRADAAALALHCAVGEAVGRMNRRMERAAARLKHKLRPRKAVARAQRRLDRRSRPRAMKRRAELVSRRKGK